MPLSEFKRNHFLCSPMPKLEPPCRTQRQACYGWAVSKTRLVIAMPPDAITAIPIEIEQNCVVRRAGDVFRPFAQSLNDRWKRCCSMTDAAVRVIRIAKPRCPPRDRHLPAEQTRGFNSPWHGFGKARSDFRPLERTPCAVNQIGVPVVG